MEFSKNRPASQMEAGRFISAHITVDFQQFGSERFDVACAGMKDGDVETGILLTIGTEVRRRFPAAKPKVDILFFNIEVDNHGRHLLTELFCPLSWHLVSSAAFTTM